jgi:hypothetical protein
MIDDLKHLQHICKIAHCITFCIKKNEKMENGSICGNLVLLTDGIDCGISFYMGVFNLQLVNK